jgi:hypothetical protein
MVLVVTTILVTLTVALVVAAVVFVHVTALRAATLMAIVTVGSVLTIVVVGAICMVIATDAMGAILVAGAYLCLRSWMRTEATKEMATGSRGGIYMTTMIRST